MARFGADYPGGFPDGFRTAFADHQPADLLVTEDWEYLGRVLDMFAAPRSGHPSRRAPWRGPGGAADPALGA
jgi:hypothetical protein